ncbi:MAG TPA: VWA domain-containing protein [Solirubrobacteraceae bacterium]|nr:VWA domain-containing protein [Solirubrobacteraceae bacterium]
MSFSSPVILVGLVAVPVLVVWYVGQQRRRRRVAAAFAAPLLTESFAPRRPGWRRHAPMLVFAIAIALLIAAAARPQHTVAVPVNSAAIMLANDISSSMSATDVAPSRLGAAQKAASKLISGVPGSVEVGLVEFARRPVLLQSPTTNHALTLGAVAGLRPGGGGTAIGEAVTTALHVLTTLPRKDGKRPPGAIVLLSDGTSNVGAGPLAAARQAKADHIAIYTISLGTTHGTIPIKKNGQTVTAPVPVSSQELAEIAQSSGGKAYTAADSAKASAVYAHLAVALGHKKVTREITADVAGGGLVLLLVGGAMSLLWFGRLV